MTLKRQRQLILVGFVMTYIGVMFSLGALQVGQFGMLVIKGFLGPVAFIGCILIAIAKIGSVEGESEG